MIVRGIAWSINCMDSLHHALNIRLAFTQELGIVL